MFFVYFIKMGDKILIDGYVILNPAELNEEIWSTLEQKIEEKYILCNHEYGYITKLCKIHNSYTSNIERNSGNVKISVRFLAERILPTIGKQLVCTVHMIFNQGIFAQVGENIKILIPTASIKNGKYTVIDGDDDYSKHSVFKISEPDRTRIIAVDDVIKITINEVKYNKNRYNCIGQLS
jgi:DNA-directed RNA polymerase subunit E'/Rpb7